MTPLQASNHQLTPTIPQTVYIARLPHSLTPYCFSSPLFSPHFSTQSICRLTSFLAQSQLHAPTRPLSAAPKGSSFSSDSSLSPLTLLPAHSIFTHNFFLLSHMAITSCLLLCLCSASSKTPWICSDYIEWSGKYKILHMNFPYLLILPVVWECR